MKRLFLQIMLMGLSLNFVSSQKLAIDKWKYIEVDNNRQKWGDWDEPDWLRYFGLDMTDVNRDGYKDIVSGRYFYMNPGGNMEGKWVRSDLGMNVDGYLFTDIDGDEYADIIAEALPEVFWFEADNLTGRSWNCRIIGEIPKTDHVNGQGGRHAQLLKGGKEEIILAAEGGIYAASVPDHPELHDSWKFNLIIKTGSSEGIGIGDIDGDGDPDITAGDLPGNQKDIPNVVYWYENPGNIDKEWVKHFAGNIVNAADRLEIADFDGNGRPDIAVSEELYPGLEPLASLYIFLNPGNSPNKEWERKKLFTGFSINNLDAGDFDNDSDIDLVTCEHKGSEHRLLLFENDGKGNFTLHIPDRGHESHLGTRLADLDSDGDSDLVSIAWDNYRFLHVWRNDAIKREYTWKHFSAKTGDIPSTNGGHEQTSSLISDLDRDGINDFVITDRSVSPSVVWYRFNKGKWDKYIIDNSGCRIEAGSAVLDIDRDGDPDIIFGGDFGSNEIWWWENPYPRYDAQKNWERHNIKKSGGVKHHDMITGDFDNDGTPELVFWNQGANTLFIAEMPANPKETDDWQRQAVYIYNDDSEMEPRGGKGVYPAWRGMNEHEGLASADIDNDGLTDIIGGGRWFKYLENGEFRANLVDASFTFTRAAAGQLIEGGRPEIILATGDGTGPLCMYEWKGKETTGTWEPKILIERLYDGHTLDLVDFNGDGHLDIFSAEMRLDPKNPGSIRILLGDGNGKFIHHSVAYDIGCHEGKITDLDGDGDYDVLSKPYNWDTPGLDIFINDTKK